MAGLGAFIISLTGPVVKKVLSSIGVGLVSYAALSTALNSVLSSAKGAIGGLSGSVLSMIQLSGCLDAASIIAGALIARVALQSIKKFEVLK